MHNKMMFSREYYKRNEFIDGFAFFEDHADRDETHVHLLIKEHPKYDQFTIQSIRTCSKKLH